MQKYGVETVNQIMEFAKKTIKEVDVLIDEAEIAINNLKAESTSLDLEQFAFTKNFIGKFNDAENDLLDARQELRGFASRTILLCENIEILIKEWQNEYAVAILLSQTQFEYLIDLIDDTKTSLSFTKEKYLAMMNKWVSIDREINNFKLKLNRASDIKSAEYERWTSHFRSGAYGDAGAGTVGMIIADIFGCLGKIIIFNEVFQKHSNLYLLIHTKGQ